MNDSVDHPINPEKDLAPYESAIRNFIEEAWRVPSAQNRMDRFEVRSDWNEKGFSQSFVHSDLGELLAQRDFPITNFWTRIIDGKRMFQFNVGGTEIFIEREAAKKVCELMGVKEEKS